MMAIFRHQPPLFIGGHQPLAPANDVAADLNGPPTVTFTWFQIDSSTMPNIIPIKKEMVAY